MELYYPMFPSVEYEPPVRPESTVFLPQHPLKMLKEGNFNYVPYIQGVNEDEGAYQGGCKLIYNSVYRLMLFKIT